MSTYKAPKRVSKRSELREDKVVTFYARSLEFFENNRMLVFGAVGGLIALVLLIVGFTFYRGNQQDKAAAQMAEATTLYEEGSYRAALDGDNGAPGLLEIADKFGSTKAGNLARFYAGDALYQLGEYDQALGYFQRFRKDNDAIGAAALAGEAAIHEVQGDHGEAADRFEDAANQFESEFTSARYLEQAGRNYMLAGDLSAAREMYEAIKDRYPDSQNASQVDFLMAQLQAKSTP